MTQATDLPQKPAYSTGVALQWVMITLALLAMANCLKHAIRHDAWGTLTLEVVKDVSVAIAVAYLYRKSHGDSNTALSLHMLLMVSLIGDWAVVLLAK